jgi:hypothetical protein
MRAFAVFVVGLCLASAGCSSNSGGSGKSQSAPPLTEADARAAVTDMVNGTQGVYGGKAKTVTLLSPLIPPSDFFFEKNPSTPRDSVACYVEIVCEPRPEHQVGLTHRTLVVVQRRDGKVVCHTNIPQKSTITEFFGEKWVADHPFPTEAKK